MKRLVLLSSWLLCVPALAQTTPANPVAATPALNWKLRLAQGQKWTQTTEVHSSSTIASALFYLSMNLVVKNEVLFANANEYIFRATFTRFEQNSDFLVAGKKQYEPNRSKFTRGFVGVPFKIKQTTSGKIIAVSGLEKLRDAGQKSIVSLASSKAEREQLTRFLPDVDTLKYLVTTYQDFALPPKPLTVGQSSVHLFETFPSNDIIETIKVKRTLRSFNQRTALFDESGQLSTYTDKPKDRELADWEAKIFQSFAAKVTGRTTVDVATGLPSTTLDLRGKFTNTSISKKGERSTSVVQKQLQVSITAKLDS